jgi:hypothetical protein
MATKASTSVRQIAVTLKSPTPSDPTRGLAELVETTAELTRRLDSLDRRNHEVQHIVDRIRGK